MSEEEMTMLKIKSLVYIITFYQLIGYGNNGDINMMGG